MPIRINLKEIFPSDPQEINVDKVNFNFNKLLELGVGTPGPIGLTGPQGPVGPIGLTGPQGTRGATWWVDSGEPNGITFPSGSLIDGDLYLDKADFNVYQYDLATDHWTLQVGISGIINSYLAANGSPFVRNFGSPLDDRFIAFAKRDDNTDFDRVVNSSLSKNGILFLNNFDETVYSNIPNLTDKYTSLLSIYPNHSDGKSSSAADGGRYHIELGSLYKFGDNINDIKLSNLTQSLKINYARDYVTTAYLTNTNDDNWINLAKFSLSDPDGNTSTIDSNSIFQFITSKYNFEGPSAVTNILSTYFGPYESLVEQGPSFEHIRADGITFYLNNSNISSTLGIITEFTHTSSRLDTENFFMLDTDPNMKGILFNREVFALENVNILSKLSIGDVDPNSDLTIVNNASIGAAYTAINAPTDSLIVSGKIGIGTSIPIVKLHISDDNELARFEGASSNSYITISPLQIDGPTDIAKLGYLNSLSLELNNGFQNGDIIFSNILGQKVWIKPDGKFGIGTSTPGSKLSVSGNTSIGDTYDTIAAPANGLIVEGTVGIGTSTPGSKLSVSGNVAIGDNYDTQIAPTNGMIVEGNVGIGTTAPTDALHVDGSIRMVDGNEEPDAIMTSDAQGVGMWTPFSIIGVPTGAVMPYYNMKLALGLQVNPPDGWLLCDGSLIPADAKYDKLNDLFVFTPGNNYTPDLRERFIVGVGDASTLGGGPYQLGQTGGEATVLLSDGETPLRRHKHSLKTEGGSPDFEDGTTIVRDGTAAITSSGGHPHTIPSDSQDPSDDNTNNVMTRRGNGDDGNNVAVFGNGDHVHPNSSFSGHTGHTQSTDPALPHENRPPYYALYYIIKY